MKMAVLGCGNMSQALLVPMKRADNTLTVSTYTPSQTRARELAKQVEGEVLTDIGEMGSFDFIFLGLKPQHLQVLARGLGPLHERQTIISILAGVPLLVIQKTFNIPSMIRLMPNLPFCVGHGVGLVTSSSNVISEHESYLLDLLRSISKIFVMPKEENIDDITPVSGSGPALLFEWANLMQDYLEKQGIDPTIGREIIVHTFFGSAKFMENSFHSFDHLRKLVTSKKGITHEALEEFRKLGLKNMMSQALERARKRAKYLSNTAQDSFF